MKSELFKKLIIIDREKKSITAPDQAALDRLVFMIENMDRTFFTVECPPQ